MPLICFASPKGGVGKTTLAANVARELARAGREVVALDLDPQNALRLPFGVPLDDRVAFTALLPARPDWRRCLRSTPSGVALLAHGACDMAAAMALAASVGAEPELLAAPLRDLLARPGLYVLADTMPGPSPLLAAALPLADLVVTVLLGDAGSASLIPAVESGASYGAAAQPPPGGAPVVYVLNQYDPRTRLGPAIAEAVARHLGRRLLGRVYRDENVAEALAAQKLVADYAPASKAAQDIAALAAALAGWLAARQGAGGVAA
jgi:cellulose synthase operon protein YhjQ